jgi:3-oxoacyl-[acyl-carrier protein] reductase
MPNATPLTPQVALVTGSSGGIGSAVATRLAKHGLNLFLGCGKNREAAQSLAATCRSFGRDVEIHQADLSNLEQASTLVATCVERFGRLDVLVHCAGSAQEELLATLDDALLHRLVNVHVLGTVALARAALRPMMRQRAGRIVLLSSVAAHQPSQGASVYAGCKGFIESFVRAMAVEVGRKGIRVNAVAPGIVDTAMTESVRKLVGAELASRTALRRLATPDEIAAAVAFLCDEESSYVNGHVLAVDGAYLGPP